MSTTFDFESLCDNDTKKLFNKFLDNVLSISNTRIAAIELNIAINNQPQLGYSSVLKEWNLLNLNSTIHECKLNADFLDNIKDGAIDTCQRHFHINAAVLLFLQSEFAHTNDFLLQNLDDRSKWRVKLNKINYSCIDTIPNPNKKPKIIINAWVNALPDCNNRLLMMIMFKKMPLFPLFTHDSATEIKCRETYRIPAISKVCVGDKIASVSLIENNGDYKFLQSNYNRLPDKDQMWSMNETSIEWNDLDMILFDYSDIYLKLFGINVFILLAFGITNVFFQWMCLGLNALWDTVHDCTDFDRMWNVVLDNDGRQALFSRTWYAFECGQMNAHKFLQHMQWFIGKEPGSCYNSVLFEHVPGYLQRLSYKTWIKTITKRETMCQLAYEMDIKVLQWYYFWNFDRCVYSQCDLRHFDRVHAWINNVGSQYIKIIHLLYKLRFKTMVDSKFAKIGDILHIVLELMFIIVVFGDVSLNTVKRLQCILKTVITLEYVKGHECGIDRSALNNREMYQSMGVTISKDCKTDVSHKHKYLDIYHTISIKLAIQQLILTPLNRMSYQSIKILLQQVSPSYDYFIQIQDDMSFIKSKYWYYLANEICWFEFLSGRISNVRKYGELESGKKLTQQVPVDDKIQQSLLKLRHAQEYCQLSSILKFRNLNLIVKPKLLAKRIIIIKNCCKKFDSHSKYVRKYCDNNSLCVFNKIVIAILCYATGFSSESAKSSDKDFDRVEMFYKQTTLDSNQFWTKHCIRKQTMWYYGLKNAMKKEKIKSCWRCKEDRQKLWKCNKCKIARYCSPKCQKIHWKIHKHVCVDIKLAIGSTCVGNIA